MLFWVGDKKQEERTEKSFVLRKMEEDTTRRPFEVFLRGSINQHHTGEGQVLIFSHKITRVARMKRTVWRAQSETVLPLNGDAF